MNWETIVSYLAPIGTGLIGFFAGKKRSDKEVEQLSLGNVEQALNIYKEMLDDMKLRYDKEIESLKSKLQESQRHIEVLERKIKEMTTVKKRVIKKNTVKNEQ
jgi:hypothetical protein